MAILKFSYEEDGDTFISPHFQIKEFRPRWNGTPDGDLIMIDEELIERLELLSDCVNNKPIHVNDGYRTEAFDIHLTGKAGYHTTGRAADIYVDGITAETLAVLAETCGFKGVGIINYRAIHVDTRPTNKTVCFRENGTTKGTETVVNSFFSFANWLHLVKIPKRHIASIEFVETREPVKTTARKFDDVACIINGGFFCTYKEPQFWFRANGITRHDYKDHMYGMTIFGGKDLRYSTVADTYDFVSGHPVLIDAHQPQDVSYANEIDGFNQRTTIGYTDDGSLVILTCDKKPGLTLKGLRQVMMYLDCHSAINLDGGGSTSMYCFGKCLNKQTDQRAVNNVIMVRTV